MSRSSDRSRGTGLIPAQSGGEGTRPPSVLVVGTFDTKEIELDMLADEIEGLGVSVVLMDTSARRWSGPQPHVLEGRHFISQERLAQAGGHTAESVDALPRGEAVSALRAGANDVIVGLMRDGIIDGVVCMGGAGTHIVGPALQLLPVGFPKLIVSPLASGSRTFEAYVGIKDVAVIHSVADIIGVNAITAEVYRSAAGYIAGAAVQYQRRSTAAVRRRPTVAVCMNGNTTAALMIARDELEERGYDFVAFHANGVGGRALEDAVSSGGIDVVIDFTLTELSGRLIGGLMDPGAHRLEAAGAAGIPQIVVPGCVDFITTGSMDVAQREFPDRTYFAHNPELTLVRLTTEEMREVARMMAEKLNAATGTVAVYIPLGGFSVPDKVGGVFWDPEADAAFVATLTGALDPRIPVVALDLHINDPAFIGRILADFDTVVGRPAAAQTR